MLDRTPPHSIESERALLSCLLTDAGSWARVEGVLNVKDFYHVPHQEVFKHMQALQEQGSPVEMMTLMGALEVSKTLASVGGMPFLIELVSAQATTSNVGHYAQHVQKLSTMRQLRHCAARLDQLSYDGIDEPVSEVLAKAEAMVLEVQQHDNGNSMKHVSADLWNFYETLYDAYISGAPNSRELFDTGYPDLNGHLGGGFTPGQYVILAARPSMGKTGFAQCLMLNLAAQGHGCAMLNMEMSRPELIARMIAIRSDVSSTTLRAVKMSAEDWTRIAESAASISELPVFMDDNTEQTMSEIRAKIRKLKLKQPNLRVIFIDYIQLIKIVLVGRESEEQGLAKVSRAMKLLGREQNVCVVVLSQLSRSLESRQDKRPMLSDLRSSGQLEQDADLVLFLYRDEYYNKDTPHRNVAELIIAKNRSGSTGVAKLFFSQPTTRFSSLVLGGVSDAF